MQRNEMGGVGVQHVSWDEDFFEKAFAQAWQCIQAVTAHQSETRHGSRVTMSERMINTKPIYEKLMLDREYIS